MKKIYAAEWLFFNQNLKKIFIWVILLFFFIGILSYAELSRDPEMALEQFERLKEVFEQKGFFASQDSFALFAMIFMNNFIASAFTVSIGIIPFLFLSFLPVAANGILLGIVEAALKALGKNDMATSIVSTVPHGIFELPAFFYASTLGIFLCLQLTKKILRKPSLALIGLFLQILRSFVLIVLPLLLIAAFIEAYITLCLLQSLNL